MNRQQRGVFGIEGEFDTGSMSVEPSLKLLADLYDFPTIHRTPTTRAQLMGSLEDWAERKDWKYPILYMSFHGFKKGVYVDDPKGPGFTRVDLGTVADVLAANAVGDKGMVGTTIHFGACSTLSASDDEIRRFFKDTGVTAVSGYRMAVTWVESIAFEVLYLSKLQAVMLDCESDEGVTPELMLNARDQVMDSRKCYGLVEALGFRLYLGDDFED